MYNQYQTNQTEVGFLTRLIMSFGAKDEKQAQQVLIFITLTFFIIAGVMVYRSTRTVPSPVTQAQIDAVFKNAKRP